MQSAAIRLLGQRPGAFFGGSGTFEMEIADLVNEVAIDIAKYQDWQAMTAFATLTVDGVQTVFDLPADYDRMLLDARIQQATSWFWGYQRVTDLNEFEWLKNIGWGMYPGIWVMYANQLHFTPAPAQNATYPYVTKNYAIDAGTQAPKAAFTSDTDAFRLPERLLTLGLIWRWRENKKLDATGDQEAFIKALDEYAAKDRGSRVYRSNSRRFFPGVRFAWPFSLGGP